jgi:hypothetical protein
MSDATRVLLAVGYRLLDRAPAVIDQGQEPGGAVPNVAGSLIDLRGARRAVVGRGSAGFAASLTVSCPYSSSSQISA